MTEEVQRRDPALRAAAAAIVVVLSLVGLAAHSALDGWLREVGQLPPVVARERLLGAFAWTVCAVCAAIVLQAIFFFRMGARVRRTARWPLQGARVLRDTPVLEGGAAVARGKLMQRAGGVLLLCALCMAGLGYRIYLSFAAGPVG